MKHPSPKIIVSIFIFLSLLFLLFFYTKNLNQKLINRYEQKESTIVQDRQGDIIFIKTNNDNNYTLYDQNIPDNIKNYFIKKEDRYFYYHFGINPISSGRALWHFLNKQKNLTASTITQQLVKILLNQENNRSLKNKLKEIFYAVSLEFHTNKAEILNMYLNSIYFGNNIQGLKTASQFYFNTAPATLNNEQIIQLLATVSSPSNNYPFTANNNKSTIAIASQLNISIDHKLLEGDIKDNKQKFQNYTYNKNYFEWLDFKLVPWRNSDPEYSNSLDYKQNKHQLTFDNKLTDNLREILKRNLQNMADNNAQNGAIIVLKQPENELLAIIGSPDPDIEAYGYKINMSMRPRPIGSTVKPFIYLKAFEKNIRPYTLVDDREYKYTISDNFAFYPKNYDYKYHGLVNLHYALSNSLNVPTVKVLEYVGINNFNDFLLNDLQLKPIQDINSYQLGIGLGGLETDLLTLAYYFSIFSNHGQLKPLIIGKQKNNPVVGYTDYSQNKTISADKYIQLINKILSDRLTGIEQFGIKSNLNLPHDNYALKTGTSREFHDSWTVGYTPDFLIAAWVGNSDNTAMDQVSGSSGAGRIWQEAMNLLYNSPYNHNTPFNFSALKTFTDKNNNLEYGLNNDDYEQFKNLLENKNLILNPHDNDIFLLQDKTKINLKAKEKADWYINNKPIGTDFNILFTPTKIGSYQIKAQNQNQTETINIFIQNDN